MQFYDTDTTDALETVNSLYSETLHKLESIVVLSSNWRHNLIKSTRWFNVYEESDGTIIIIWKYNHLFKTLEPEILARMYKYYPANFNVFGIQIASKGCFSNGCHN